MFLRHVIVFSFIALLAGCAGLTSREAVEGKGDPAQWRQHKEQLTTLDGWQINGKVGIRAPKDSGSGTLFWLQRQDGVSLEVANQGRYEAPTPETLLEEQLGWKLPVSHLVWWVRGLPAPDSKSRLTLDGDSRLASLEQDGWQVEYLSYVEQNGYWLPERVKLHGQDLDVTLVIKDWQPRKLGQ
jgi:outer membrane lipoprotein LolB